jgi:hypothetical protein
MSETKIQVTDGKTTWLTTPKELAELNRGRPQYLPAITPVREDAQIRSVYKNADGDVVDAMLPAEQVIQRARATGQNVAADETSIEQARVARESRERMAIADEADLTAFLNAALPGAQFMQNLAVGEDAANQARQELNTNVGASFAGNIAEFALGGKMIGAAGKALLGAERAGKIGTVLGFGENSSRLSRVGRVAMENAAIDTHFYVQNNLDTGNEFSGEEWGRQLGLGMLLGSPFIAGAAGRGIGGAIRDAVGQSNALGMVRTGVTAGAVFAPPGSAQAATRARTAAGLGLVNKLFNFGKKRRAMGATDEVFQAQKQMQRNLDHVRVASPENVKSPKFWSRYKEYADGPLNGLDEVDWKGTVKATNTMTKEVEGVRRAARDVFRQLEGSGKHATWKNFTMSEPARNRLITRANEALNFTSDVGMSEIAGTIKRKVLANNASPEAIRKAIVEAAFAAKLRRGVTGGADQVDDILSSLLKDKEVWGRNTKRNAAVVDALDEVRQVWDDLGDTHMAKPLRQVQVTDGVNLQKGQGSIDRMRKSIQALADEGMLSERQVTAFETRFIQADDAIARGTEAYMDVIKLNKHLDDTLGKLQKQAEVGVDVPTSPESFAATRAAAAMEVGKDIAGLASKGLDMLLSTKPMAYGSRGVGAIVGMTASEKYQVYDELERELNDLVGNPMYMVDNLGQALDRGAAYDPIGADVAGSKVANSLFYLQSQMPKRDMTIFGRNAPQPLSAVEEFLEKWAAVYDPVSVGYEALQGTITPAMVDAVRATSPATYAEMQVTIAELLSQVPADKANPSALVGASLFMGGLDPMYSGDFIAKIQSSYAQTAAQDEVMNGPRPGGQATAGSGQPIGLTTSQRQQTY